jgi:hypothetical protein
MVRSATPDGMLTAFPGVSDVTTVSSVVTSAVLAGGR